MADKPDFTEQYAALFSSPFGDDLRKSLTDLHSSLIDDAERSDGQEKAYGLLKQASGVMLALTHLKGRAVVPKVRKSGGA